MVKPKEKEVADAAVTDGNGETEEIKDPKPDEIVDDTQETKDEELAEEEHKERSSLGRKVSAIENRLDSRMDSLTENIDRLVELQTQRISESKETDEDEEEFVTRKALRQELVQQTEKQQKEKTRYQGSYNQMLGQLGRDEDENTHAEILKELEQHHNFIRFNDPVKDADYNYTKAARAYFKKQLNLKEKTVPIRGGNNKLPLGSGSGEEEVETTKKDTKPLPALDDAAKDYIKRRGLSEDQVRKALSADLPPTITGKIA